MLACLHPNAKAVCGVDATIRKRMSLVGVPRAIGSNAETRFSIQYLGKFGRCGVIPSDPSCQI